MRLLVKIKARRAAWKEDYEALREQVEQEYPHHARLVATEADGEIHLWLSLGIESEAFELLGHLADRERRPPVSSHLARMVWLNEGAIGESVDAHLFAVFCSLPKGREEAMARRVWDEPDLRWHSAVHDLSTMSFIFLIGSSQGVEGLRSRFVAPYATDVRFARLFTSTLIR